MSYFAEMNWKRRGKKRRIPTRTKRRKVQKGRQIRDYWFTSSSKFILKGRRSGGLTSDVLSIKLGICRGVWFEKGSPHPRRFLASNLVLLVHTTPTQRGLEEGTKGKEKRSRGGTGLKISGNSLKSGGGVPPPPRPAWLLASMLVVLVHKTSI